jgi:hypothetical protein
MIFKLSYKTRTWPVEPLYINIKSFVDLKSLKVLTVLSMSNLDDILLAIEGKFPYFMILTCSSLRIYSYSISSKG